MKILTRVKEGGAWKSAPMSIADRGILNDASLDLERIELVERDGKTYQYEHYRMSVPEPVFFEDAMEVAA